MSHSVVWVKLRKYVELTGDTAASVHARRRAGKWLDGIQCKVVDDMLWINLVSAEKWVETWGQNVPVLASSCARAQKQNQSELYSATGASSVVNRSNLRTPRKILPMPPDEGEKS